MDDSRIWVARSLIRDAKTTLDELADELGGNRYLDAARYSLGVVDGQLHILEAT